MLRIGAVDQWIGAAAGSEAISPEALNPTEAPECRVDIGKGGSSRWWVRWVWNSTILAAQDENGTLGSVENVVWSVELRFGGAASDVTGVEEGIDVLEGPMVSGHVFEYRCGCSGTEGSITCPFWA